MAFCGQIKAYLPANSFGFMIVGSETPINVQYWSIIVKLRGNSPKTDDLVDLSILSDDEKLDALNKLWLKTPLIKKMPEAIEEIQAV